MEGIVVLVGCVVSFLCGAYVRSPFVIFGRREKKRKSDEECENEEMDRQWENFWSYDGEKQE